MKVREGSTFLRILTCFCTEGLASSRRLPNANILTTYPLLPSPAKSAQNCLLPHSEGIRSGDGLLGASEHEVCERSWKILSYAYITQLPSSHL